MSTSRDWVLWDTWQHWCKWRNPPIHYNRLESRNEASQHPTFPLTPQFFSSCRRNPVSTIRVNIAHYYNGTLPSKLPFFSLRLTKSESGHAFSLIRQKSTWWLVGKMMILPHFTLLTLSSCRLVIAHLDSGSRYTVWYFIDIEYRHLVSDSLTPLVCK